MAGEYNPWGDWPYYPNIPIPTWPTLLPVPWQPVMTPQITVTDTTTWPDMKDAQIADLQRQVAHLRGQVVSLRRRIKRSRKETTYGEK